VLRVEGARSLLHMGQAGYISTTHQSLLHSTLSITVHFNGSNGTAYIRPLSVRYSYDLPLWLPPPLFRGWGERNRQLARWEWLSSAGDRGNTKNIHPERICGLVHSPAVGHQPSPHLQQLDLQLLAWHLSSSSSTSGEGVVLAIKYLVWA
jgi:hypothetical protein